MTSSKRIRGSGPIEYVPIEKMKYLFGVSQREHWNQARVDKLVAELDLKMIGFPVVSERDDGYHVVDGMHRVEALRKTGYGDLSIRCEVFRGLSDAQEARTFRKLNDKLTVSAYDDFTTGVAEGAPAETEIDKIVRACGLVVGRRDEDGAVKCVGTLVKIYKRAGGLTLERTLRMARDAYGNAGMDRFVIDGLALFVHRYDGLFDEADAVQRLGSIHGGAEGLLGRARTAHKQRLGSMPHCVAASAVEIINRGVGRKKLPVWWKV